MKINYYLLIITTLLSITTSCKKEVLTPFVEKNYFKEFQTKQVQLFDLDTISFKEIKGTRGTKIYFDRELFDIKEGEKIQLELIELYDFKEVLYRNIQTVTTDNKLLESSGVLKVTFTSNGKELKLREGQLLRVYPPKGKLKDNDIFLSQTDSLGNINWDLTSQKYYDTIVNVGGGITQMITIPYDSLYSFRTTLKKRRKNYDDLRKSNKKLFILKKNTSKWINIDRFVDVTAKINFELEDKYDAFSGFNIYTTYKGLNSFMYDIRLKEEMSFYNVPIVGKTFITIIGENKEGVFYDEIELKEAMNNATIQINMKKTSKDKLQEMFN